MNAFALILVTGLFQVQTPGTFHAGEAVAANNETWLALRREPDAEAMLIATTLRVQPAFDPILDQEGEQTASEVASPSIERSDDVIAYLRGPTLQPGPVHAVATPGALSIEQPLHLAPVDGIAGTLRYRCEPDTEAEADAPRCELIYQRGDRTQSLAGFDTWRDDTGRLMLGDDAQPRLLFAGDLDRDGAPDLVLDVSGHYNVTHIVLWLSGSADSRELLHAAARLEAVGC